MGEIVYAIGDIHGRADLLSLAFEAIVSESQSGRIVLLGDLIDRGDSSSEVMEMLCEGLPGFDIVPIMGNHEDMMLRASKDPYGIDAELWIRNGGGETVRSYGFDPMSVDPGRFFSSMPSRHLDLMRSMRLFYDDGERLYVHAGIVPDVPLESQDKDDMLWIREGFLDSDADFGRLVVHGHTPVSEPEVKANRVNLDTGAYHSGVLTCAAFEPGCLTPRLIRVECDRFLVP